MLSSLRRAIAGLLAATMTLAFAVPVLVARPARAQGLPDLTADGWLDHEPLIEGYPYLLTLAVKNVGEAPAGNFTVLMQYSGYGGPELVDIPASSPVLPGETRILRYSNFTGTQGTAGFGISVDHYDVIEESSEENNQVSRSWDGISPYERPYLRIPVYNNGTSTGRLSPESAWIYYADLGPGDVFRYEVTGSDPGQPSDVFLFFGETNLNTYFGFGDFRPEHWHDDVASAEGEFLALRNDTVYLAVDNLSDGPYPPWPQALNVTVAIELERAPSPPPGYDPVYGPLLLTMFVPIGILAAAILALVGYFVLRRRPAGSLMPAAAARAMTCPSCGLPIGIPSSFCGRCGAPLIPLGPRRPPPGP
jgi:hypothetical protein